MRKRTLPARPIVAILLLAVLVLPAAGARAAPSTCGRGWLGAGICSFPLAGSPLEVTGQAAGVIASVTVQIWVASSGWSGAGGPRLLLSCAAAPAPGAAACSGTAIAPPDVAPGTMLECWVQGEVSGTYACASGT